MTECTTYEVIKQSTGENMMPDASADFGPVSARKIANDLFLDNRDETFNVWQCRGDRRLRELIYTTAYP